MNKKVIIPVAIIFTIVLGLVIFLIFNISKSNDANDVANGAEEESTKEYDLDDRLDWLEVYYAGEGWYIEENKEYKSNQGANYQEILQNQGIELQIISDFEDKVLLKSAENYVEYMNNEYKSFQFKEFSDSRISLNNRNYVGNWFTDRGGVFIFTNKSSLVHGIFITPLYYGRTEAEQLEIQNVINNHEEIFGEPHYTFVDELYDQNGERGYRANFYPELGIAFAGDTIFLHNPVEENIEEFVEIIGIDYTRQNLGCKYCQYGVVIEE